MSLHEGEGVTSKPPVYSVPLKQGPSPLEKKCVKRAWHSWKSVAIIMNPTTGDDVVVPATHEARTHRACTDCGKVLPVQRKGEVMTEAMSKYCEVPNPNLKYVKCERIADGPQQHVGPCAREVVLEWEVDEKGRAKNSAIVNGRIDDLELRYKSSPEAVEPDVEATPTVDIGPEDDE